MYCALQLLLDGGVAAFAMLGMLGTDEIRASPPNKGGGSTTGHVNSPESHCCAKVLRQGCGMHSRHLRALKALAPPCAVAAKTRLMH